MKTIDITQIKVININVCNITDNGENYEFNKETITTLTDLNKIFNLVIIRTKNIFRQCNEH